MTITFCLSQNIPGVYFARGVILPFTPGYWENSKTLREAGSWLDPRPSIHLLDESKKFNPRHFWFTFSNPTNAKSVFLLQTWFFLLFQDFISYSLLAFLYLSSTSLVASAIDYYQKLGSHVEQWTVEQLIVSVVS